MMYRSSGNMYSWVTHTWNPVKGRCFHGCSYCFMTKWKNSHQKDIHIDDAEFMTDLGAGNFIFVGSSVDLWAIDVPDEWILQVLDYCDRFDSRYLFQSKNPDRFLTFATHPVFHKSVFCTTLETNRWYPHVMHNSPKPQFRAAAMVGMKDLGFTTLITAEPLMDFDFEPMVDLLMACAPSQVNIGKNTSWNCTVPEPTAAKAQALVDALKEKTVVDIKSNASKWNLHL